MNELIGIPQKIKRSDHELATLRAKIMETGSEFQPVNRDDIIGIDNILKEVDAIVAWLKNPEEFKKFGTRLEPGLLLEGSPGTGKTLCSRYIASCSNALFLNVRDWPTRGEIISAQDISDLFKTCRDFYKFQGRPVIVFWDEFEIFARERERSSLSMRDASVVTQLTAELDGIGGKYPGVLFIGCTNYKRQIDQALLRPGRMGIHIKFVAPDREGKAQLLRHYMSKFALAPDLDWNSASYFFNEDDTAAAVEEAAHKVWLNVVANSLRSGGHPVVTQEMMNAVLLENLLGPPPPFMELRPDSEYAVAVHELGHAFTALKLGVPIRVITIQPGRDSFGRVITHNIDPKIANVEDVKKQIAVCLGSIASEQLLGIPNSAHASSDTKVATNLAIKLVDELGHYVSNTDLPPYNIESFSERNVYVTGAISKGIIDSADSRITSIMYSAFRASREALADVGRSTIQEIALQLTQDKTWTGKQFEEIHNGLLPVSKDDGDRSRRNILDLPYPRQSVPLD